MYKDNHKTINPRAFPICLATTLNQKYNKFVFSSFIS